MDAVSFIMDGAPSWRKPKRFPFLPEWERKLKIHQSTYNVK